MPMQILPTASLRSGNRLPAARAVVRACNHLIWMALWPIGRVIFRLASNFLPALREARVYRDPAGSTANTRPGVPPDWHGGGSACPPPIFSYPGLLRA